MFYFFPFSYYAFDILKQTLQYLLNVLLYMTLVFCEYECFFMFFLCNFVFVFKMQKFIMLTLGFEPRTFLRYNVYSGHTYIIPKKMILIWIRSI